MKPSISRISAMLFFVSLSYSCAVQQQQSTPYVQRESVNYQVFYDELSPYGQWVDYPNYGYVWLPDAEQNFSPYSTDGYWVNTEYGWTWVSDFKWGWAPFHYGRWDFDNNYGWFWVPDNQWGPSWVNWRSGNGYYGWEPMRPGLNNNQNFDQGNRDFNRWNFVHDRDFGRSDINRYYIDRGQNVTIINNSIVINNTYVDKSRNTTYISGPSRENVQQVTGRRINSVAIRDSNRPGQNLNKNQLQIYRPQVERTVDRGQKPTPTRITKMDEVKSARQRNATNPRNNVTPMDNSRKQQQTQPGQPMERGRQQQPQQPQQKQPMQPQQQQVTPQQQQQQNERRRQDVQQQQQQIERRKQEVQQQQQQLEKQNQQQQQSQPVHPQQQQVTPQQQQQQQLEKQNQQRQPAQPAQQQQRQVTPTQPQQPQVMPPQQQPQVIPPQQPQQRRRQERQQVKQQQRNAAAPAGNTRRERQPKANEVPAKE